MLGGIKTVEVLIKTVEVLIPPYCTEGRRPLPSEAKEGP